MSIGKKMGLGFGILLAFMATLAAVVLMHIDNMHRQFSSVIQYDAPAIANARHLLKLVVDMETGQRGFVITGKQEFLEPYESGRIEFANLIRMEKALVSDNPSQLKRLAKIEAYVQEWETKAAEPEISARRVMNNHSETLQDVAAMVEIGPGKRILDRIRTECQLFIDDEKALMKKRFTAATLTANTTTRTTIVLTLVSLIVGGGMALMITLGITKPARSLASALAMVAKGDLSQKIEIKSSDEIGKLSRSFNQMMGDLRQLNEGRKRDEQALRGAKEYTDNIIRSMIDLLVVVARDGSIISVNESTSRLLGYQEQELIGKPASLLFSTEEDEEDADDAAQLALSQSEFPLQRKVLRNLVKEGHFNNIETPLLANDGHKIPALLSGALMKDEQGEIRGVVCVARDITDRKKSEKALRTSETRSRALLEGSPVCNKIIDLDSRLLYMSAAGINQLKIPNINLLYGRTYPGDIYPESMRLPFLEPLERAKAGEVTSVECPLLDAEGNDVWYHTTFVPARDDEGQIVYVIATSVNITERKKAEDETAKLQAQLRHAQKMEAIGQLATGVAHEFNNVLVGIRGNAELLLNRSESSLPDGMKQPLKDIERSGVRAYEITQQLLSFARKKNHHVTVFDVNRIVADSNRMLQRLIGTQITLKTELSDDPAFVRADESELEQALMNLVINARDAMPDGGELIIRTGIETLEQDGVPQHCAAGRFVQLAVADDGCGMSPEIVERIFEPFFTTKSVGKGTGLGLSRVYSDIANSDGFVSVESHQGTGTVINIYLPLSQQVAVDAIAETESLSSGDTRGGETILVCDDEEIVLSSVSALLQSVGYCVIAANSAREALEAADANAEEIALLVTDLTMPEMDGVELGKEIHRRHPHMKIIYSSGYAADYVEICAQDDDVEILEKGRSSHEMFRRIREVLDKDAPSDNQISGKAG